MGKGQFPTEINQIIYNQSNAHHSHSLLIFLSVVTAMPESNWQYWDGDKYNEDDNTLTLEFSSLSPCQLLKVDGGGLRVTFSQGFSFGNYR